MSRWLLRSVLVGVLSVGVACAPENKPVCGNGKLEGTEQCDDGNTVGGDACSSQCTVPAPVCGNGRKEAGEACDDGNAVAGDGCEANCTATPDSGMTAKCGNGVREGTELCDDGDADDANGCTKTCVFSAPSAYCGDGTKNGSEACDDGNVTSGDGCEIDCTVSITADAGNVCGDGVKGGSELCDDGNADNTDGCRADCTPTTVTTVVCPAASQTVPAGTCSVVPGSASTLLVGTVLQPGRVLKGGQVLVDATGVITCAACDCVTGQAAQPTTLLCGDSVITPGLINSHDHLTYAAAPYVTPGTVDGGLLDDGGIPERYEHRNDWRVGGSGHDGHTKISNGGSAMGDQVSWNELRQLMAGTTSVAGSGGAKGLLRNLDAPDTSTTGDSQQGLGANTAGGKYDTFPVGDSGGEEVVGSCAYKSLPKAASLPGDAVYLPHISEGIEPSARNEFLCLSNLQAGGSNIFGPRTAMIHGIGLKPADVRFVSLAKSSLVWSPRSNIILYGETADVPVYARMGVQIALGTDWVRSGSMNLLREFACADYLNQSMYHGYLSDLSLWRLATVNAAKADVVSSKVGTIEVGKIADLAIFRASTTASPYRAVLAAKPQDVLLTMRGGKVMFVDSSVVTPMGLTGCETIDVCGQSRSLCLAGDGLKYADLKAANDALSTYPLFFCNGPGPDEPVCAPVRGKPWLFSGSNQYTSVATADDQDGDGIADATDNCPTVFNPIRPMDFGKQADADGDGTGDLCDVCPLDKSTTACSAPLANDLDNDGKNNDVDNCVTDPNPLQTDTDGDLKGDACDACPAYANPGTAACPPTPGTLVSIYDIKGLAGTYLGQKVQLKNALVTATASQGFFLQVHESDTGYTGRDFSAVYVFYTGSTPRTDILAGDRIDIIAAGAANFNGQIQLSGLIPSGIKVLTHGNPLPAPVSLTIAEATTAERQRALEGVLVTIAPPVVVTNNAPDAGTGDAPPTNEFLVSSAATGAPEFRVNDFFYKVNPLPAVGETFTLLQGVLEYRNANYKLEPRSIDDLRRPPAIASFGPNNQFLRVGDVGAATIPSPLLVTLNSKQGVDTTFSVTSSDPTAVTVVGDSVVIPAGQLTAPVLLNALLPDASVTLTSRLASVDAGFTASLWVLSNDQVPAGVVLSPATLSVSNGQSGQLAATLDVPAPDGGTLVALSSSALGTVPASVLVPANQRTASFLFTANDAGTTGASTVTATVGSSMATAAVTVTAGNATDLFFSEYGEGGVGNNKYVEIFNGTGAPVDLSYYALQSYTNGAATASFTLNLTGTLENGKTYVICNSSIDATLKGKCDKADTTTALTFNGNDIVALQKNGSAAIDIIGVPGMDPKTGWAVCGVAAATMDHILTRKPSVSSPTLDWVASAGTSTADCQWSVASAATLADITTNNTLGTHVFSP